jgi:hypothetical protein
VKASGPSPTPVSPTQHSEENRPRPVIVRVAVPQLGRPVAVIAGVRALRASPIVLILALAASTTASAAHGSNAHCTIPHGWKVVAQDQYAVVTKQRHEQHPEYDYCSRAGRRFHRMVDASIFWPVLDLQLKGHYVAYEAESSGDPGEAGLWLWDTRSGRASSAPDTPTIPSTPDVVLSPNGVATWIVSWVPAHAVPTTQVEVLTGHADLVLDRVSPPGAGTLANLQLYDCAAGCAPNTTIVAWTNDGAQRYAAVTG